VPHYTTLAEYGVAHTHFFWEERSNAGITGTNWGKAGTANIDKDGGGFTTATNTPGEVGNGLYRITITATEMQAATVTLFIEDSTNFDEVVYTFHTYGNASAYHGLGIGADVTAIEDTAIATTAAGYMPSDLRRIDGVALDTHDAGKTPADVRMVDGVVLSTHSAGLFPADVRAFAGGTNAAFIDLIWDELKAGHVAANSMGRMLQDIDSTITTLALDADLQSLITDVATIDTVVDGIAVQTTAIEIDTGTTLPAEHALLATAANLATVDTVVDGIAVQTTAIEIDTGTTLPAEHALLATAANLATVDTVVDGIAVQTTAIEIDTGTTLPAEHALLATAANLATVDTVVDGIAVQTTAIEIDTSTTLPAEHALLATAANLATVDTVVDGIAVQTTVIAADTTTDIPAQISALNNISTAQVNTEVDTALVDIGLDHLVSAAVVGADVTDDSIIANMVSKSATPDWDTFNNETDSLEAAADSSGLSSGLITASWGFDTSTVAADPGAGDVRLDSATPGSVTNIYISQTTDNSFDAGFILNQLGVGDTIQVAQADDGSAYVTGTVGTKVDNTGWWTIPITVTSSGTLPGNNKLCAVSFLFVTSAGPTAAAIADAVLTEAVGDHTGTAGSLAEFVDAVLTDTNATLPATLTTIEGKVDTVDTVVDSIQTDTTLILANLAAVDTVVDLILVDTTAILAATTSISSTTGLIPLILVKVL